MTHHDKEDEHLSSDDPAIKQEGEKNREEMDHVPEPGTDPLHEGP